MKGDGFMREIKIEKDKLIPCVPTRDLVVFEDMTVNFEVARGFTISAVKKAMNSDGFVFLIAQRSVAVEDPEKKDLYKYGILGEVRQVIKSPGGVYRCLVHGISKGKLLDLVKVKDNCLYASIRLVNIGREKVSEVELTALMRQVSEAFENYLEVIPRIPKELYYDVASAETPKELFEAIAYNIPLPTDDKQIMLDLNTYGERLAYLLSTLSHEIEVSMLEREIHEHVSSTIDSQQREYFIREQIRALHNELGDGSDVDESDEAQQYLSKISELSASDEVKDKLTAEAKRLVKMPSGTQEAVVIRNYLDTCLALPWSEKTEDRRDIKKAESILEKDHYGMKKVKERVLENLAVRMMTPDIKGQVICLYGPPGVGKTSVGKSIARALDRKYVRVSLGGVRDESDIRGHRKTYVGAMPGRIIDAMKQAGTKNPVILLDEIDKMSNDFRGDPSSAMLEVLDGEQNSGFRDHFIELPFDLSEVLFITTANSLDTVAAPLLDRMEVIELASYTREEKYNIAKLHLIPKQRAKHGLKASQINISKDAIYSLIDFYTKEAGVRKLERSIASLCRKAVKKLLEDGEEKISFKAANLEEYLGHKKYLPDLASEKDEVGMVNGLAWTSVGGVLMPLEVLVLEGKGKVELTGSLGDVMKESGQIAVSYCRSVCDKYGIAPDFYEKKDLHIHAPEGAVPKDGPSAGVTMVTAMVSALSGIPVRKDVAMTGEITLHGKVLPIGGLREKLMAAYKAKIKTVIIPAKNKGDLDEVDDVVKDGLEIIFADNLGTVLENALVKVTKPVKPGKTAAKRKRKAVLTAN